MDSIAPSLLLAPFRHARSPQISYYAQPVCCVLAAQGHLDGQRRARPITAVTPMRARARSPLTGLSEVWAELYYAAESLCGGLSRQCGCGSESRRALPKSWLRREPPGTGERTPHWRWGPS